MKINSFYEHLLISLTLLNGTEHKTKNETNQIYFTCLQNHRHLKYRFFFFKRLSATESMRIYENIQHNLKL